MASFNWSVPANVSLAWRQWDGDFVVFNPASGDTHFLNGVAGAVLKRLETSPASFAELVSHLEDASGEPLDDELIERVRELVDRLDSVGLIEPSRR